MWLKLVSCLTGFGVIAYTYIPHVLAQQTTADTHLPLNQRTQITNNSLNFQIDGGATQGTNLFHSFSKFSVPAGGEAFFNNTTTVQNIFSRVTGSLPSNIQGTIRANGTANLFLINPQGIVFGPNARLNIGGSFLASTASAVKFADGREFSATNPDAATLLTISQPIGLQFGLNLRRIENQSRATDSLNQLIGLQVQPEKTLALVGGDVTLAGGILTAPNGQIQLGSVAENSMVQLISTPTSYILGYEGVSSFQDINLRQQSAVTTIGNLGGSIHLQGANVLLTDGSLIRVGIFGAGSGAGLTVNASESVRLSGTDNRLSILNEGDATTGNLTINTPRLLLQDGAEVVSATSGSRKGGDVNVNATQLVQVTGTSSRLFTQAENSATGNGGNVQIITPTLLVQNGGQISGITLGRGKGGNVTVNASRSVELVGTSTVNEFASSVLSQAGMQATESAGDVAITTPLLRVLDGARVFTNTLGAGNAGNLQVNANELVALIGRSRDGQFISGLFNQSERNTTGNAGNITIHTPMLRVLDGAQISGSTFGEGRGGNVTVNADTAIELIGRPINANSSSGIFSQTQRSKLAGDITINTTSLRILDGAQISASTLGTGQAGNVAINAAEIVELIGRSRDAEGKFPSGVFNQAEMTARGNAGNVLISTPVLRVLDGAQVSVGTLGAGQGGNINVNASNSVELIGRSRDSRFASGLFSQAERQATGNGGDVTVNTPRLRVLDGAQISVGTLGQGKGGNVTVNAGELQLIGRSRDGRFASGLFNQSESTATGDAGNITIHTDLFRVLDGAQVSANTFRDGEGGNLNVNASQLVELIGRSADSQFGSGLFTQTQGSKAAGDVIINTPLLRVFDGAEVSARTLGSAPGGNVTINANNLLRVQNGAQISVSSTGNLTPAGTINISAGSIVLDGSEITAQTFSGNGGNLTFRIANVLLLRRGSEISTTAGTNADGGNGGNITIDTPNGFVVAIPSENSDITANAFTGSGGRIEITAQNLFGIQSRLFETPESDITASSQFGINGVVNINTPDVDPSRGVVALSTDVIDPSQRVEEGCAAFDGSQGSQFTFTGRGGLPANPNEPLSSEVVWSDIRLPKNSTQRHQFRNITAKLPNAADTIPKIPASGWILNNKGEVTLIAHASTTTHNTSWSISTCHAR